MAGSKYVIPEDIQQKDLITILNMIIEDLYTNMSTTKDRTEDLEIKIKKSQKQTMAAVSVEKYQPAYNTLFNDTTDYFKDGDNANQIFGHIGKMITPWGNDFSINDIGNSITIRMAWFHTVSE
jgi:uncharacterized coiled-coil protein SlyX